MSYDIRIVDESGNQVFLDGEHFLRGGTYAMGGTKEAWLNVTYNYSPHFYRLFGEKGIRSLYGMDVKQSIPVIEKAISALAQDENDDYWKPTEGNARKALLDLVALANMVSAGKWDGD